MDAKFITVEGIDGAGKSTIAQWIAAWLKEKNIDVILTHEPGGTPGGKKIRELLLTRSWHPKAETLLFFADRAEHVKTCILPALQQGIWVVCDRFIDSTFAYQVGGRDIEEAVVEQLAQWVLENAWPDLTFLLDIPVETALARTNRNDCIARENHIFFTRVRDAFLQRAQAEPDRIIVLDASKPLEIVQGKILTILEAYCI
jgi:dTMP kinase